MSKTKKTPRTVPTLKKSDRPEYFRQRWITNVLASRKVDRKHTYNGTPCMRWTKYINVVNGYGQQRVSPHFKLLGSVKVAGAHRCVYAILVGEIPKDHHIDHLCDNRWCTNHEHMKACLQAENSIRANYVRWGKQDPTDNPAPF